MGPGQPTAASPAVSVGPEPMHQYHHQQYDYHHRSTSSQAQLTARVEALVVEQLHHQLSSLVQDATRGEGPWRTGGLGSHWGVQVAFSEICGTEEKSQKHFRDSLRHHLLFLSFFFFSPPPFLVHY